MRAAGVAALGLAFTVAGLAFGSPSLIVPGFALLGLAGAAVLWIELSLRGARVERVQGPARIVEGDAYPLELRLHRGTVPPPGGEVSDALLGDSIATGPFRPDAITAEIMMPRRGRHVLDDTAWVIGDPLGLHSRTVKAPVGGELLVVPRIESVRIGGVASVDGEGAGAASAGEEGAAHIREARAVEFEVDGLRPYRHGSSASRIHWPAFARSGEMHERRIVAGAEATPLVALDAEDAADEEALDRAVRAAASLCVHLAPGAGCAILLPGSRVPSVLDSRLRGWPSLHAKFAIVRSGAPTRLPARSAGLRGGVFWVTARAPGAGLLPRSAGPGNHYLVSAFEPRGAVAFQVAGCFGVAASSRQRPLSKAAA